MNDAIIVGRRPSARLNLIANRDYFGEKLKVIGALQYNRADAGIISNLTLKREKRSGNLETNELKVLWTSPPFDNFIFDSIPPLWSEGAEVYKGAIENYRSILLGLNWDDLQRRQILEPRSGCHLARKYTNSSAQH